MLLWDEKNKERIIRVKGVEKERVKASDFGLLTTKDADEASVKAKVDSKLDGYHIRIHITSKLSSLPSTDELSYIMWIGPVGTEPRVPPGKTYWWEALEKDERPDIREIG